MICISTLILYNCKHSFNIIFSSPQLFLFSCWLNCSTFNHINHYRSHSCVMKFLLKVSEVLSYHKLYLKHSSILSPFVSTSFCMIDSRVLKTLLKKTKKLQTKQNREDKTNSVDRTRRRRNIIRQMLIVSSFIKTSVLNVNI